MKELINKIRYWRHFDKLKHFAVCFIAAAAGYEGLFIGIGLAIGKETGDHFAQGNKWDWLDIAADAAGLAAGYTINKLFL